MKYVYNPQGVCSKQIELDINEKDEIVSCNIVGGCPGNTKAVSRLIVGMKVQDVVNRLEGIKCGIKNSSCPDQLSKALAIYLKEKYSL